jgi:small subunit ribosomal protein S20
MAKADDKKKQKVKRPSAQKRDIQHEKKRLRNKSFRSSVRTTIRSFEESLSKGDQETIKAKLSDVYSAMDKGVKKGVYPLNKASRTKARLTARAVAAQK